ncbi:MAG TPA: histidine phosphatase family protein [Spirochaetota bacterium]|nr:histidine phosphatase family protein [Spirochaetota bacterium]
METTEKTLTGNGTPGIFTLNETGLDREHAEFHNSYREEAIKDDIRFLQSIYGERLGLSADQVGTDFINELKVLGKKIYFFILGLEHDLTPQDYIKYKFDFLQNSVPGANPHLFYLAWNGLIKNDSFKRLLRQKFALNRFSEVLVPKNIPAFGSRHTRYRTKFVLAIEDMEINPGGEVRTTGRILDDGSGMILHEGIVWLSNGKGIPILPEAYVPKNQAQVITVRHGKSIHESGGENPEFVGSGYWDNWKNNRRISGAVGNKLKPKGIDTARELGRDFKVIVDVLNEKGYPLWPDSKDQPVIVYGSESENTEETARCFLEEGGFPNITFYPLYGLNSQKYGALTSKFKNDVYRQMLEVYGPNMSGTDDEKKKAVKEFFKNRFYHFPEGESLIEADWRIAHSFMDLMKNNLGKRVVLCDHSGALRVFEAVIRTLDFAEYASIKEGQDSIIAMIYQPGTNVRYDYLQKKGFSLRK